VEILEVDLLAVRQHRLELCIGTLFLGELLVSLAQDFVALHVILAKLFLGQLECLAKLDSDLLLLEENELVILHVLLRVHFKVGAQLMQVEAIFVRTPLPTQEELAELASAERCPYHAIVENELVDAENRDGAFPCRVKSEVGGVRGAAAGSVVDIVRVHYHFCQVAVLSEVLYGFQFFLRGDLWCKSNNID